VGCRVPTPCWAATMHRGVGTKAAFQRLPGMAALSPCAQARRRVPPTPYPTLAHVPSWRQGGERGGLFPACSRTQPHAPLLVSPTLCTHASRRQRSSARLCPCAAAGGVGGAVLRMLSSLYNRNHNFVMKTIMIILLIYSLAARGGGGAVLRVQPRPAGGRPGPALRPHTSRG
jgi:hypothetical protein